MAEHQYTLSETPYNTLRGTTCLSVAGGTLVVEDLYPRKSPLPKEYL